MPSEKKLAQTKAFISYSRRDKEFVTKLNEALDTSGINTWVDWEGIPLSSDWMAEITEAIQAADALLFVISPDSLQSKVCREELELGIKYNKKIIPILYREPEKDNEMHEKIAATNWVYMRPSDDFAATLPKLVDTMQTDLDWVRQHTRLTVRAVEWEQKKRDPSFLLQGVELADAETWRNQAAGAGNREITPLQADFIDASRQHANALQRRALIGVLIALGISLVLTVVAVILGIRAYFNEVEARAQRNAAQARIFQDQAGKLQDSTLMAIIALQDSPNEPQAMDILRRNIAYLPAPILQFESNAGEIYAMNYAPNGNFFVVASEQNVACVFEITSNQPRYCVQHAGEVRDALFSADSDLLFTASTDGTLKVWNAQSGAAVHSISLGATAYDIDLNSTGTLLAIGRADGIATLYNINEKTTLDIPATPGAEIYTVRFSPTRDTLAIGGESGQLVLWNGGAPWTTNFEQGEIYAIAFSPNGRQVVSGGSDSYAHMFDVASGEKQYSVLHLDWVESIAFSPSGAWFVTASDDNYAYIWDAEKGTELRRMQHQDFILKVRISPDGNWIATTGYDRTVRIWNASTGGQFMEIPLRQYGAAINFSPDGAQLIYGDRAGNGGLVNIAQVKANLGYVQYPEIARSISFSPDNRWVVVNTDEKLVRIYAASEWNTRTNGTLSGIIVHKANNLTYQTSFTSDSVWLGILEPNSRQVVLYKTGDGKKRILQAEKRLNAFAFSPDNALIVTADAEGTISLWNMQTSELQASYTVRAGRPLYSITFSADGREIWAGSEDVVLRISASTGRVLQELELAGEVRAVAAHPSQSLVAAIGSKGTMRIWAWNESSQNYVSIARHTRNGEGLSLAFSPNGEMLAMGNSSGFVYMFATATLEEIFRIPNGAKVESIAFTPNGQTIGVPTRKAVQIWRVDKFTPVSDANLIATACSRLTANFSDVEWQDLFDNAPYQHTCPDLPKGKSEE
jgi:WD40 repeat protein